MYHENDDGSRHGLIPRGIVVVVVAILLLLFAGPYIVMGIMAVSDATKHVRSSPSQADLNLIPVRWRDDDNIRKYLADNDDVFDVSFSSMAYSSQYAKPGEGECFAALGVLRGVRSEAHAGMVIQRWFNDAPVAIADETTHWVKAHRDNAWKSLEFPKDDRRRAFWRQLVAGALAYRPDAQLHLMNDSLQLGTPATKSAWTAASGGTK